jgi:predicted CoA-binding protein
MTASSDNLQTQLKDIDSTSISIIISPTQGLPILQSLFRPGAKHPRAVWFQPGAESDEIRKFVKAQNLEDRVILGGPCILVLGSGLMSERKQSKL